MSKLIPRELLDQIPILGETEDSADPIVYCRLFHPLTDWCWYILECDSKTGTYFGLVHGASVEFGFFTEQELASVRINGLAIERDKNWKPRPLSKI